ncbi:ras and Rab interactor 3 isoform X2 [Choloepus didactylus]|uniref:ras and Rab interactor 3 isoform X2 n=1 Tax=Choloepus didactylus TaxID=27675 RepID=UPI00189D337D|nr:ras and Rab interactor 3 isoform X2 [Choloepus didactylus]
MIRRAGAPARGDPEGPVPDAGKGEGEDQEEGDGMGPCPPAAPRNCLPRRGLSVLEKLVKTCPVWLQLGLGRAEAARILCREAAGMFLVCRDSSLKRLVLCVHFPSLNESWPQVLEYTIKEEKSILYLEGSVLVFEDIFRLIAFYCVSRDLLPFTLRLPQAILEASSFSDLEAISNLGLGFWESSLNPRPGGESPAERPRDPAPRAPPASGLRPPAPPADCACEIELSGGNERLWFVNPIFIEDCGSALPAQLPPPGSCPVPPMPSPSDATSPTSRWAPRRPPPPPPASSLSPPVNPHSLARSPSLVPPPLPTPALACPLSLSPHPPEALPLASPVSAPHPAPQPLGPPDHPSQPPTTACERLPHPTPGPGHLGEEEMKPGVAPSPLQLAAVPPVPVKKSLPAAPPRRRVSERVSLDGQDVAAEGTRATPLGLPSQETSDGSGDRPPRTMEQGQEAEAKASGLGGMPEPPRRVRQPPVPPPRKKRISRQQALALRRPPESAELTTEEVASVKPVPGPSREDASPAPQAGAQSRHTPAGARPQSSSEFKGSLASLSDSLGVPSSATDQDSYSTSSTEEELEQFSSPHARKKQSMILGKARHRLSFVSFTSVFNAFLSNNRKLYKKVVELAQDKTSYFGSLVQDYKVYSLEMMARQTSSTEMLQEIRTMMTQLKSYLLQSTELKALVDPILHSEEELGKPYGADDFLPVLMYVLARSNLTEMLLNVEYMMELMDPALQLGEGSYYLTTTYGALEHIKNYDRITVTRQLSVEVQDSIHRWERRRTLNKARASRSSVQDFICVSYLEPEHQARTLASRADTLAQALCAQCAEKFEVARPQDHRLFVLVDGRCFQLADEALPHRIKGYLLRSEPKRDFHFVYRPLDGGGGGEGPPCLVVREPNFL